MPMEVWAATAPTRCGSKRLWIRNQKGDMAMLPQSYRTTKGASARLSDWCRDEDFA